MLCGLLENMWSIIIIRLHSAIGYISPKTKLEGHEKQIFAERDRKLEMARERRKVNRNRKQTFVGKKQYMTSEVIV